MILNDSNNFLLYRINFFKLVNMPFPKHDYNRSEKGEQRNDTMFWMTHKLRTSWLSQSFLWHVTPYRICNQYDVSNWSYYQGKLQETLYFAVHQVCAFSQFEIASSSAFKVCTICGKLSPFMNKVVSSANRIGMVCWQTLTRSLIGSELVFKDLWQDT